MEHALLFAALLGHVALWVEVVNRTHGVGWSKGVVDAWTITCGVALFAGPGLALTFGATGWSTLSTAGKAYALICLIALAYLVFQRALIALGIESDPGVTRTHTEQLDLTAILEPSGEHSSRIAWLAGMPGNQLLKPRFEHRTHRVDQLPGALEGLKIAHLTDLHMSGRLPIEYFQAIVDKTNTWEPDLVCVTGDIVEHPEQLEWIEPTLGQLRSKVGAYFVLGNHDRHAGPDALRVALTEAGLVDLGGRSENSEALPGVTLCGDERPWFEGEASLENRDGFTLCLAHTPDRIVWAQEHGVDLVLAGHCHGGQVCFPLIGPLLCPSMHGIRYAAGSFRRGRTSMHVSRGAGSLFPLRYLCPPEIGLITLKCRDSSGR